MGYRNEGRKGRGIQALRAAGSTSGRCTVATPPACQKPLKLDGIEMANWS